MMRVTSQQAHDIINDNDGNQDARIASFSEIQSTSYGYIASWKSYYIALSERNADKSYLLLASPLVPSDPPADTTLEPVTLPALAVLLSTILNKTAVPVPRPVAHDVSGGDSKWHFGWLLLRVPGAAQTYPAPSLASVRGQLSPAQRARIELRLGTHLRALHGLTNDWFGVPVDTPVLAPPAVPSFASLFAATGEGGGGLEEDMTQYSWQDTFLLRLEELVERVCCGAGRMVDIDIDALRRALFRAIGSFLFDDVEMPGLIWVTGGEEDVVVSLEGGEGGTADIAYILPTFGHALWGDPLMEAWFLPPGPTKTMNEGYFGGEDGTLMYLPRHKTKRTWYTVYLALLVLAEEISQEEGEKQTTEKETVRWARGVLPECIEFLKDAPCY